MLKEAECKKQRQSVALLDTQLLSSSATHVSSINFLETANGTKVDGSKSMSNIYWNRSSILNHMRSLLCTTNGIK